MVENIYKNKKIFVTGHTGFKGSWLLAYLDILGAQVKGYSLASQNGEDLFNVVSKNVNFESVIGDIRDKEKLQKEIESFAPDFVFHLAAQALVRESYIKPSETFEINVLGTANLLESISKLSNKCAVIIVTTDKVYKNREIDYYYNEEDELGGYDPYSASKAATELVVNSFRDSFFNVNSYNAHKKSIATVRAGNVIGGGDWNKDRIVPDIITALSSSKTIEVRNPESVRPWQHVLEPLTGYLKIGAQLYNDIKFSGAYNFGPLPQDHLSVKNFVETAIETWGSGNWGKSINTLQPHEAGLLKLDIKKAQKLLNWHPKLNCNEAIEWTINWYKQKAEVKYDYTISQIKRYLQR